MTFAEMGAALQSFGYSRVHPATQHTFVSRLQSCSGAALSPLLSYVRSTFMFYERSHKSAIGEPYYETTQLGKLLQQASPSIAPTIAEDIITTDLVHIRYLHCIFAYLQAHGHIPTPP